ncbi:hypothetical protein [Streptomyces sp. NRRL F-5630]|uniref:hypothetical protein n=1 Tax=Streptomyces sp. NRRL F-5630 TaxID=1463864 RepID=UPI003D702F5D
MPTYGLILRLNGYDAVDWPEDPSERLPTLSRLLGDTSNLAALDLTPRLCIWTDGDRQYNDTLPKNEAATLISALRAEPPLTPRYGTAVVTGGTDVDGRVQGLTPRQFVALLALIGVYTPEIPKQRTE